jgi:recombination protein RecT
MAEQKKQAQVAKKEITESVLAKVNSFKETGQLVLPKDYSPANALKGAMLVLQEAKDKNKKPVLEVCTRESIANSLLSMITEGLSVLKSQGYFIPYGNKLSWMRSYQGSIALSKRVANVKEVNANVIYKGDDFTYGIDVETGRKKVLKHDQSIDNIKNEGIKGAYAVVVYNDGSTDIEVMTIQEIEQAWSQGYGKGDTHKKFTQEMAKKTVINRACKTPINASTDAHLNLNNNDQDLEEQKSSFNRQNESVKTESLEAEDVEFEDAEEVKEEKASVKKEPSETKEKNELNF